MNNHLLSNSVRNDVQLRSSAQLHLTVNCNNCQLSRARYRRSAIYLDNTYKEIIEANRI